MAEKIFGAAGCNKSELKLVRRPPGTATTTAPAGEPATRQPR